jgi:hypothetical protein
VPHVSKELLQVKDGKCQVLVGQYPRFLKRPVGLQPQSNFPRLFLTQGLLCLSKYELDWTHRYESRLLNHVKAINPVSSLDDHLALFTTGCGAFLFALLTAGYVVLRHINWQDVQTQDRTRCDCPAVNKICESKCTVHDSDKLLSCWGRGFQLLRRDF